MWTILFFLLLPTIFFVCAHILNSMSVLVRVLHSKESGAFQSHVSESKLKYFSGYSAILYSITISFMIESNIGVAIFVMSYFLSLITLVAYFLFALNDIRNFTLYHKKFLRFLSRQNQTPLKEDEKCVKLDLNKSITNDESLVWFSALSFCPLVLGYFISFLLSYAAKDYRLTLFQLSAVMHGVGTFLSIFIVNQRVANIMDSNTITSNVVIIRCLGSFIFGRLLTTILMLAPTSLLLLYFIIY